MHAEKCPVCGGSGKVYPSQDVNTTAVTLPEPCHGCRGLGWVPVPDNPEDLAVVVEFGNVVKGLLARPSRERE
jgi:hypothetical protein